MQIHEIIRTRRTALGLTQEQLAGKLGVSAPAVNKWERGNSYPDITLLPVLARTLTALQLAKRVDEIVVASREEDLLDISDLCRTYGITKCSKVVRGGARSCASSPTATRWHTALRGCWRVF